jgi:hypothetical protein
MLIPQAAKKSAIPLWVPDSIAPSFSSLAGTTVSQLKSLEPTLSLGAERIDLSWIIRLLNMFIISNPRSYMKPSYSQQLHWLPQDIYTITGQTLDFPHQT